MNNQTHSRRLRRSIVALAAALVAFLAFLAPPAEAGSFVLHQCGGVKPAQGGFSARSPHPSTYRATDTCSQGGSSPALEVTQISGATAGKRGFWLLAARDPSLRFTAVSARVKLVSGSNSRARLAATSTDNAADWGTLIGDGGVLPDDWVNVSRSGLNHPFIKLGLECFAATCNLQNPAQVAKGRNFAITVSDSGAPNVAASGELFNEVEPIKDPQNGSVSATDSGAGVHYIQTTVNGIVINTSANSCPDVSGGVATTQTPCRAAHSATFSSNVNGAPWQYGTNSVWVCAYDYRTAGTANSRCTARTVKVDNRADGPTSLTGAPAGWINDKAKLSLNVGVPSSVAPLIRMHYRVLGPGGYGRTSSKSSGFSRLTGADLPPLGGPGTYTVRVWFEDSRGNINEGGTAKSIDFRFDPVKPEVAWLARHEGWIAAHELDHVQGWSRPANDGAYPSGLRGYAISIHRDPDVDPCQGGASQDCEAAEITHGPGVQSITLGREDWPDGMYYVSSVPVTNAGNRGPRDQVRLRIDTTNPVAGISGIPSGWSRIPVTPTVTATDATSGMAVPADAAEAPDGPPLTGISVGGSAWETQPGDRIGTTIDADGVHAVRYFARDLAGNRNDGSATSGFRFAEPGTATVRIDATAPNGRFRRPAAHHPTLQRIPVRDATSGISNVRIQLRRQGTEDWLVLETERSGDEHVARIDESEWERGAYEMRAVAADVAANTAVLDRFGDDSPAVLTLPLREPTRAWIDAERTRRGKKPGSRRHTVGYGTRPVYRGLLHNSKGKPIADAGVTVRERFDAGAVRKRGLVRTRTDAKGRYRVSGSLGPSRITRARFDGDRRYLPARSSLVRTLVRGRVKLTSVPRNVEAGRPAVFRGKIAHRGVRIPGRGKVYEVQILVPGEGWKTLDQAQRSRPDGHFRFVYRFRPVSRPVAFKVRVQVKRDAEWAFTQARSRTVRVTVHP